MYAHPQQRVDYDTHVLRRQAGAWLRELRTGHNLSQRDLARLVGVEYYSFIAQLEAGRGRVPPDRYETWARALGVNVQAFTRRLMAYYDPVTYKLLFGEPDFSSEMAPLGGAP